MGIAESPRILRLKEARANHIPISDLSSHQAELIHRRYEDRIVVEKPTFSRPHHYSLFPKGYVGHFPVADDLALHVETKTPVSNLFAMLEEVYELDFLLEGEGSTVETVEGLFENLAAILASRVLRLARQGVYRDYVVQEDELATVRGRISVLPSLRTSVRGSLRMVCEYAEHSNDLEDNQILAWTLYLLTRGAFKRKAVEHRVREAYRAIGAGVTLRAITPDHLDRRTYHQLNEGYRSLHQLCRFVLEQTGPSLGIGNATFLPFAVNMPRLFEAFVAQRIAGSLTLPLSVAIQDRLRFGKGDELEFKFDVVIRDTSNKTVLAVLDTKYKASERFSNEDIQQIVAYATGLHAKKALLVYPFSCPSQSFPVGGVTVTTLGFPLDVSLDASAPAFMERLRGVLFG